MRSIGVRELQRNARDHLHAAEAGETITVTRRGQPVAQLVPIQPQPMRASALLERWRNVPSVDSDGLRADVDAALDSR
jgi:prevent-host-death family protein